LVTDMVNQSYKNIASSIPQSLSLFVKVPEKQDIFDMASIHLIPDATDLALSHYCGNENLMENATSKRDNMLKDIDDLVSDVAKESSGLFASAIENYIENRSEMKCLKDIVNSIWNDRVEPGYPVRNDELQNNEPINDLNLLIVLRKAEVLSQK